MKTSFNCIGSTAFGPSLHIDHAVTTSLIQPLVDVSSQLYQAHEVPELNDENDPINSTHEIIDFGTLQELITSLSAEGFRGEIDPEDPQVYAEV